MIELTMRRSFGLRDGERTLFPLGRTKPIPAVIVDADSLCPPSRKVLMGLQRNVFTMLDRSARSYYGDHECLGFEGEARTFRQLRDRALSVAAGLEAHGVKPGDRVAVMMGNRIEWPEVFFGLAAMGAVCVPVNVLLVGPEIEHVCDDSGARVLVMDEIASQSVAGLASAFELVVTVGGAVAPEGVTSVGYEKVLSSGSPDDRPTGSDLDDEFVLYYSSGTTGRPKAAVHTHGGVLWNAFGQVLGLHLTRDVRYAVVPSFSWAAGFHIVFLPLIWIGGYSQIKRTGSTTADDIVRMLVDDRITHVMLVPSILRELLKRPDLMEELRTSSLQWIITGSEPVPRSVIDPCVEALPGVAVVQGYGLSEFPAVATVLEAHEVADHDGSAGRPLPHCDVAVRGESGQVESSGRGELLIRSNATMRGYHNRLEQTAEAFRDGWMNTGDLVDLDEDGFVTVVGRTKDLIISGGLNVYPKEVEDVIHTLPGVVEVAVVGVPDERFGEAPVAIVVADGEFDEVEVHRVCEEQLAKYKRPRQVFVRAEALPRNANAKLLKRELRPWAEARIAGTTA
ncbi:class I adenylate-forming enzyme family protein [Micromonospora olivasterospora]|uniref:class I adenylate-forming enzyme family protein n=1 Tax=Micromonospora olivasterospora TaxID=1880 RepID=UPI0011A52680|nr:class I adenylate-forming enzyme family protein [Micromonospora olivasterospora]